MIVRTHYVLDIFNIPCWLFIIGGPFYLSFKHPEFGYPLIFILSIIWICVSLIAIMGVVWPIGHMIYLKIMRNTSVNFKQARELTPLFSIIGGLTWYPVKGLKKLPKSDRVAFLYWLLKNSMEQGAIKYPKYEIYKKILGLKEDFDDVEYNESWNIYFQ